MPQWVEWVTFGLATVGAVLGVIATWAGLHRDRPRLVVRPVWGRVLHGPGGMRAHAWSRGTGAVDRFSGGFIGIEVINTGYVTVYLREVGFCPLRTSFFQRFKELVEPEGRGAIVGDYLGVERFPRELLPGARCVVAADPSTYGAESILKARSAYAITETECLVIGKGPVLNELRGKMRRDAKEAR